ncbi:ATP-binding protein [Streptomyces sp. NPDC056749]|uniref:ATP-binding protein n=1 Tax=Streptomyces sp. NPDC056749 TaxID=3345936 RepID=UPI0036CB856F
MLEVVALSALTTFLLGVGNGAAGELGKSLTLSAGTLVRRSLGRETPLPAGAEDRRELAERVYARVARDPQQAAEWALLMESEPAQATAARSSRGMPPAPWAFTNHQKTLKRLMGEATRPWDGRPRVVLLSGSPGSGTTAVATRFGAVNRDRFPEDRQFYVDLRDAAAQNEPEPAAVLLRLLREMGVGPADVPPTEEGREQLYRQLTAGLNALVVIDHVTSLAQVRALVPATPDVFLLVVVSGPPLLLDAERVPVPPLSDRYARQMVRKIAGPENAARVKAQLPEVLDRCQGNPLALRAEALMLARGGNDSHRAGQGTGARRQDPVRDAVAHTSLRLAPAAVRLCWLTALGSWPSVSAEIAAAAAGMDDASEAARLLAEAADVELLERLPHARYRFRPEVRRPLADTAASKYGALECSDAVARVLDALLNRILPAAHAALPTSWRTETAPLSPDGPRTESEGIAVLAAEAANIVRAVSLAEDHQQITTALRLARALWPLQLKAGHWDEVLPALRDATRCAEDNHADPRTAGALYFQLAHCLGELGRWEQANRAARAAVRHERAAEHLRGEASSVELLGLLSLNRWLYEEAYERFAEAEGIYRRITSGQEDKADLPRSLALVERHQGRALRGMGQLDESRRCLTSAVDFFAGTDERPAEAYNHARALTDLAETLHAIGDDAEALKKIAEAEALLTPQAAPHLRYLAALRRRCEAGIR